MHGGHSVDSNALGAALDWHWEGEAGRTGRFSIEPGRGGAFPLVFHPEDPQKGLSSKRVMTFAIRKCPREATMPLRGEEPERGGQADRGAGGRPGTEPHGTSGGGWQDSRGEQGWTGELALVLISCKLPLDSARKGYFWELGRKFGKCKKLSIYLRVWPPRLVFTTPPQPKAARGQEASVERACSGLRRPRGSVWPRPGAMERVPGPRLSRMQRAPVGVTRTSAWTPRALGRQRGWTGRGCGTDEKGN